MNQPISLMFRVAVGTLVATAAIAYEFGLGGPRIIGAALLACGVVSIISARRISSSHPLIIAAFGVGVVLVGALSFIEV
jgi:hypothetical protein